MRRKNSTFELLRTFSELEVPVSLLSPGAPGTSLKKEEEWSTVCCLAIPI